LGLSIQLGDDCEVRRIYPLPSEEKVIGPPHIRDPSPLPGGRTIECGPDQLKFRISEYDAGALNFIVSELITVSFELRSETELRNRLLFDTGLYMDLGVSLVFGGIHEALKIAAELKRK
jgi:hypothetical protein